MNCLLLLIILFCCNGNGCNRNVCNESGRRESCGRKNCAEHITCETVHRNRECAVENRSSAENRSSSDHGHCDKRTQFPYLDVEPRTCGCEEKVNN